MVHDDVIAEARPRGRGIVAIRVEEAVDHRQPVRLPVSQAGADQLAAHAPDRGRAVFDDVRIDRGMLNHVGIILLVHPRHAAARMTRAEIAAQQLELSSLRRSNLRCVALGTNSSVTTRTDTQAAQPAHEGR
ncbi:hypothetical protein WR25_11256 [Diploscapter pachys]|uniref:Uncharacterized protein n=1 Tax=Diploscapter pachys TaxID=2018661 RepID=A0A2A2M5Q6_9BILA|nr:hypothetical protein WR25_11256 [Diploscapter pachys]